MKQSRYAILIFTGLLSALSAAPSLAAPCVATTIDAQEARVSSREGAFTVTFGRPVPLGECQGAKVDGGRVCFLITDKQRRQTCLSKQAGQAVSDTEASGGAKGDLLAFIVTLMRGERQNIAGGKHMHNVETVPGLPYGVILPPGRAMTLRGSLPGGRLEQFSVSADGTQRPLAAQSRPGADVTIDGAALKPGRNFHWRAVVAGRSYEGDFTVASPDRVREVEEDLRDRMSVGGQDAQEIVRAIVYEEHGFPFDRDRVLSHYRR